MVPADGLIPAMARAHVALATATDAAGHDPDEPLLLAALARRQVEARMAVWDDPTIEWASFDLVVLRSTWDYPERLAEFLTWLERVASATTLANPLAMVRWSLDKHYLAELAAAGVPIVPTMFLEPGDGVEPPEHGEYVLKPAVGAGSRDAARYRAGTGDDTAAVAHVERLHAAGRSVLLQPYVGSVDADGETPMVYVDGQFSHAASKRVTLPRAGSMVPGLFAPEDNGPHEATDDARRVADAAMAAVPAALGQPLYGRVDLVRDDAGRPAVLELELAEPSLFLPEHPVAADRVASAIVAAAERARGSSRPG